MEPEQITSDTPGLTAAGASLILFLFTFVYVYLYVDGRRSRATSARGGKNKGKKMKKMKVAVEGERRGGLMYVSRRSPMPRCGTNTPPHAESRPAAPGVVVRVREPHDMKTPNRKAGTYI